MNLEIIQNQEVEFQFEYEGGFTAIVSTLPGCISFGETLEESREMVSEAIDLYLEYQSEKIIP